jgi:hypothetical protein
VTIQGGKEDMEMKMSSIICAIAPRRFWFLIDWE